MKAARLLSFILALAAFSCSKTDDIPALSSVHLPLPPAIESTGPARRVLLISIDGLRPDALTSAPAITLLSLIKEGAHCPEAETLARSETLPSHASMLTGREVERHGVTWNDHRPGHLSIPTIFTIARAEGFSTASLYAKDKFAYLMPEEGVHWSLGPRPGGRMPRAEQIADAFQREWPEHSYQLTFVHFGDPDASGHAEGWMSEPYLAAVRRTDRAVRTILETLRKAGAYESTTLILTSDHGGHDRIHYVAGAKGRIEDTTIPWICVGPQVPKGYVLHRTIRTTETAATVLRFLGLRFREPVDGTAVDEVFAPR